MGLQRVEHDLVTEQQHGVIDSDTVLVTLQNENPSLKFNDLFNLSKLANLNPDNITSSLVYSP